MATTTVTTRTTSGSLRGGIEGGVAVFRGVPYARPPVGPLRFAPPRPPDVWAGERDATAFGPPAMQAANPVTGARTVAAPSEDCLTLKVWTPAADDARRPVLVWLHGGGFLFGAGSAPMYDGAALARRGDAVVVTVTYRLGLFGYLRGVDVCGAALPSTGHAGLLDQLAALAWVRREVATFGGDPDNVTVVGQSAGAASIGAMLAMPRARGLFHKAVLQSGALNLLRTPAAANRVTETILADVGLAPREAGRLRELPAARLLDAQARVTPRGLGLAYGPVCDGAELPADPEAAIAAGSAAGIPLLAGTTLEEQRFWRRLDRELAQLTNDALLARLRDPRATARAGEHAPFDAEAAVARYRQARAARGEGTAPADLWVAILSDGVFRAPLTWLAERHADHTPETYAYLFTWRSPAWEGRLGAGHGVEIPFVFGTLDVPDAQERVPAGTAPAGLAAQMQDAWVAFARAGSPRTPELPGWEPYSAPRRCTMLLGATSGPVDAPYDAERRFWAAHAAAGAARPPAPHR